MSNQDIGLNELRDMAHGLAVEKGWHREITEADHRINLAGLALALRHASLSDDLEDIRSTGIVDGDLMQVAKRHMQCHGLDESKQACVAELGMKIALIQSELSEALDAALDGCIDTWTGDDGKPEGLMVELGDAVIRIADLVGKLGLDLADAVRRKHEYNKTRPYRHGNRKA